MVKQGKSLGAPPVGTQRAEDNQDRPPAKEEATEPGSLCRGRWVGWHAAWVGLGTDVQCDVFYICTSEGVYFYPCRPPDVETPDDPGNYTT